MFSHFREIEQQPGTMLDSIAERALDAVDKNLDANRGALQLEMIAEAARNAKVAALLRTADRSVHTRLRQLLIGPRGSLSQIDPDALDGRIEVISALFNGLLIRAVLNPSLKREAVLAAIIPMLRVALTPYNK